MAAHTLCSVANYSDYFERLRITEQLGTH